MTPFNTPSAIDLSRIAHGDTQHQALIPVTLRTIGGKPVQTVNARELHAFLESGRLFANWIQERVEKYGFVENSDYLINRVVTQHPSGAKHSVDYYLTLDMAKEIAMVERNAKGKEARQYFIECERRLLAQAQAQAPQHHIPQTLPDALRLAADLADQNAQMQQQLAQAAPKINFYNHVAEATNCHTLEDAAKVLECGRNTLMAALRNDSILMRTNLPYQRYINAGYFRVRETLSTDEAGTVHIHCRTTVTGKGLQWLQRWIVQRRISVARVYQELIEHVPFEDALDKTLTSDRLDAEQDARQGPLH